MAATTFPPTMKRPDVGATRLLDVFLDQDVGVELAEGRDHRVGRFPRLGQDHAKALGALEQLDHDRGTTHDLEQAVDVLGGMGEAGRGEADTGA